MTINRALADSLLSVTESWNVELEIIDDGKRAIKLTSPYALSYHSGSSETHMDGPVSVVVRDDDGEIKTRVRSESAIYTARDTRFIFKGGVIVETSDEKTLLTELLNWHQKERSISTDEFIIITTPADSISGYGLDGVDDLSSYTIRRVTGEFQINSN